MSEETAMTPAETEPETPEVEAEDQRVPYERFEQVNKKAKEADARAKAAEKKASDLQAQVEAREQAGLPELEQLKKRLEAADKRAAELEHENDTERANTAKLLKEQLISTAAKDFRSTKAAVALLKERGEFDDIETPQDAERALKRLVKDEGDYLLKTEETPLPGRVLQNGQTSATDTQAGRINLTDEAQLISDNLKQFLKDR